jgi:hypothetical protein
MVTKQPANKDAEMLAAMTIHILPPDDGGVSSIEIINVISFVPRHNLAPTVIDWFHRFSWVFGHGHPSW